MSELARALKLHRVLSVNTGHNVLLQDTTTVVYVWEGYRHVHYEGPNDMLHLVNKYTPEGLNELINAAVHVTL